MHLGSLYKGLERPDVSILDLELNSNEQTFVDDIFEGVKAL